MSRPSSRTRRSQGQGRPRLEFNSFWTIELEPGWSLFATHPVNRDDLPFRLISGLVDSIAFMTAGSISRRSGCSGFFRGAAERHAGGAVFRRARAALQLEFESFDEAHRQAYSKTVARCWPRPTSIANISAPGAGERDPEKWLLVFSDERLCSSKRSCPNKRS